MEYKVVDSGTTQELSDKVTSYLKLGYTLYGSVQVSQYENKHGSVSRRFVQSLTRENISVMKRRVK